MDSRRYLKLTEAASLLGTTYDSLYSQVRRGTFPAMRISPKRWRIDIRDIDSYLSVNRNDVDVPKSSRVMDLDYYDSLPIPSSLV